jgi:hypothetical protein
MLLNNFWFAVDVSYLFFLVQAVSGPCFRHFPIIAVSVYLTVAHRAIETIN